MLSRTSAQTPPDPAEAGEQAAPDALAPAEPAVCQFCDAPATAACFRCATLYCADHGAATCDACSDPASGLPSRWLFYGVLGGLSAGVVLALWLLFVPPPPLPSEHPPPAGTESPAVATAPAGGGGAATPAPGATGAAGAGATPAAVSQTYVVKQGDTLLAIATQHGTTVDAIRAANPGINEAALQIGQEIVIPGR